MQIPVYLEFQNNLLILLDRIHVFYDSKYCSLHYQSNAVITSYSIPSSFKEQIKSLQTFTLNFLE